jgi:hypothetical protein
MPNDGVEITQHKNWNTKKIRNRQGYVVMTYRRVPKQLHFKHPMINDANQNLCGGWYLIDAHKTREVTLDRVIDGLKPFGVINFRTSSWDTPEAIDADRVSAERAARVAHEHGLDARVLPQYLRDRPGVIWAWKTVVAQKTTLRELFDLRALALDYIDNGIYQPEYIAASMSQYADRRLIDFAEGWDWEDVPPWLTGLLLGYPIENTISLLKQ